MPELEDGHLLGRYRIEGFLAEGGMGRVYRAIDTLLGRRVALKVLASDEAPGSPAVARLVRGARAAAAFSHPNVCAVFDAGEIDGQPFIAMELVEGTSLRTLIADPAVDAARRLGWMLDLARALAATHRARVVHRDIKPDNVMVGDDGRVRLLDFGVARWEDDATEPEQPGRATVGFHTQAGRVIGTPGYMAPEQLDGGAVDARTDQFAWAVLTYETLARRRPFGTGDELRTPALLSTVAPTLPFGVAAVVAKAMAFEPGERFADMEALVAQLEPLVVAAAPVAAARRSRLRGRLVAGLAAVTVVVGAGLAVRGVHGRPAAPAGAALLEISHPRRLTFGTGCEETPSFLPDGRSVVYSATDSAGRFRLFSVELDGSAAPRPIVAPERDSRDIAPAVSPRGDRVAFLRLGLAGSSAMIAPLDGSGPPRAFGTASLYPRWSYDGRAIWAGKYGDLARFDPDTGELLRAVTLPGDLHTAGAMFERADGSLVAQVTHGDPSNTAGLAMLAADDQLVWQTDGDLEPALAPSPDGAYAVTSRTTIGGQAELVAIPLDGKPPVSLAATGVVAHEGLAIAADGRRLAWSACHAVARVSAIDATGQFSPVMPGEEADALAFAWIPGSHDLAVASVRTGAPRLWVMDPAGARSPRLIATGERAVRDVAISPDGARFVVVLDGGGLGVGALRDPAAFRLLTDDAYDKGPAFRSDGEVVLFTRRLADGTARVMQVSLGGGPATPFLDGDSHGVAVSPAGDRVAYLAGVPAALPTLADPRGGSRRPLSPALAAGRYRELRFSTDGRRVAVIRGDNELVEIDAASGEVLRSVAAEPGDSLYSPAYADLGLLVLRAHWQGNLWVADATFAAAGK